LIVFQIVFAFLGVACLISFPIYIGLIASGKNQALYSTVDARLLGWKSKVFLSFAAIGILVCVYHGTKGLIGWIPSEWIGNSADENHVNFLNLISLLVAFSSGFPLIGILDKYTHSQFFLRQMNVQNSELIRILENVGDLDRLKEVKSDFEKKIFELSENCNRGPVGYTEESFFLPEGQLVLIYRKLIVQVDLQIRKTQNKIY